MKPEEIVQRIQAEYPDAIVETEGADCNFAVRIISAAFEGMNPIQRQRPVMALFREDITSGALHALSITARTPTEAGR